MFTYKKEKDLHNFIVDNFSYYFDFDYLKSEVLIPKGRIDILGEDETTIYVVEIKRDIIDKFAIRQVSDYIPQVKELYPDKKVVGIAIAPEIDSKASEIDTNIKIVKIDNVNYVPPVSKSTLKTFSVTLEENLIEKLKEVSKESMISQSRIIRDIVEKNLDSYRKQLDSYK